ncbi:MAG TPA: hypothetical protein VG713_20670, partial [Pirellulales bacterium]|nr:hypothetical protein [Pirellulales bacterium]
MRRIAIVSCFVLSMLAEANLSTAIAQPELFGRRSAFAEAPEEDDEKELETDRDAFTPATSIVGRRNTVVESSYSFINNRIVADTDSLPELLVRHGVSERFEFRIGWNYEVGGSSDVVSGNEGADSFEGRVEHESEI